MTGLRVRAVALGVMHHDVSDQINRHRDPHFTVGTGARCRCRKALNSSFAPPRHTGQPAPTAGQRKSMVGADVADCAVDIRGRSPQIHQTPARQQVGASTRIDNRAHSWSVSAAYGAGHQNSHGSGFPVISASGQPSARHIYSIVRFLELYIKYSRSQAFAPSGFQLKIRPLAPAESRMSQVECKRAKPDPSWMLKAVSIDRAHFSCDNNSIYILSSTSRLLHI